MWERGGNISERMCICIRECVLEEKVLCTCTCVTVCVGVKALETI